MTLKKISDLNFSNRLSNQCPYLFEAVTPTPLNDVKLLHVNSVLANQLEISPEEFQKKSTLELLNGNLHFDGIRFLSSYYAGHQFGHFVPRLGDGRAISMGEICNSKNEFFELQLKGAGLTPFSRMGDGKAVLRSSIREYLASAHLKALGVKTTEALSLVHGSDPVRRETVETAAMVLRVSESFVRFGHFEFLYFHGFHEELKHFTDKVIELYFNDFSEMPNKYFLFFQEVSKRTAKLMASWQSIGFCHGVMNTDNMSILGLTIDYGPFGFLDRFDPDHICNHSDYEGRYSFGNQPPIAKWNLEKLAIAISPLLKKEDSDKILENYELTFNLEYQNLLRRKLGLTKIQSDDNDFFRKLLNMLVVTKLDYTNFFRQLCYYRVGERGDSPLPEQLSQFLDEYDKRLTAENSNDEERNLRLKTINPKFVLRNYLAQIVIEENEKLDILFKILTNPYEEWSEYEDWSKPAPEKYQFLCVSCSS